MADEETQAGSPPVVVPNPNEQSLRDHFERILLISEEAAASLAEQVMEVFTEKEEQVQQLLAIVEVCYPNLKQFDEYIKSYLARERRWFKKNKDTEEVDQRYP